VVANRNSPQKHVWPAKVVFLTAAGTARQRSWRLSKSRHYRPEHRTGTRGSFRPPGRSGAPPATSKYELGPDRLVEPVAVPDSHHNRVRLGWVRTDAVRPRTARPDHNTQKVFKSFLKQHGGESAGQSKNAGPRTAAGGASRAPSRGIAATSRSGGGPRLAGGGKGR